VPVGRAQLVTKVAFVAARRSTAGAAIPVDGNPSRRLPRPLPSTERPQVDQERYARFVVALTSPARGTPTGTPLTAATR
jgi:hypothetical protein